LTFTALYGNNYNVAEFTIKGELGEIQIYFRMIPMYQQKFLVVSVLSNLPWLPRYWKNVQN